MKSQAFKATKPCTRVRIEKLLKKVDRLTIELEDTSNSIKMITDAINHEESRFRSMYANVNAEYRLNYEKDMENFENRLQERLDETTKIINEKKKLSEQLESLITGTKAQEENITKDCIEQIRKSMEVKMEQARTEWKRGQQEREDTWMSERVKEVRKRTLEALQPQVQKLLLSHKDEIEEAKAEFSTLEESTKRDLESYFHKRVADYKRYVDVEAKIAFEKRKEFWMGQLHHLQNEHSMKMRQMTNQNEREEKNTWLNEFKEEINTMTEKHNAKLQLLQRSGEKHIENLHRQFDEKMEKARVEFESKKKDIHESHSKTREKIQNEKQAALRSQFESKMISTRTEMKKVRDNQIDEIIKCFQEEETVYEQELRYKYEQAKQQIMTDHKSTIDRLQKEISERERERSISSLKTGEEVMQACTDELELVQMRTYKAEEKISTIDREEELQQILVNPKIETFSSSIFKKEEKVQQLQKDIDKLIDNMSSISASSKEELDKIKNDHEKSLESLEREVKPSIALIEKEICETDREIARYKNRVERQREIFVEYSTMNEQKAE
jgi:hypothetical protein